MTDDGCRLSADRYTLAAGCWLYSREQGGACGARVLWSERFPTRRSRHRHLERKIYEKIFSRRFILPPE